MAESDSPLDPGAVGFALQEIYRLRDDELRERFDRSLSFDDAMFDRWERARRLGFGEETSIYNSSFVLGDVRVGEHTWIGPGTLLDGSGGGLEIGSWCSVSAGVHLYTHDTVLWSVSLGHLSRATGAVRIGDGTYLGAQSIVIAGVTIGSQCVIGANSFVDGDVPDRAVVAGSPARPIGMVRGDGDEVEIVIGPDAVSGLAWVRP